MLHAVVRITLQARRSAETSGTEISGNLRDREISGDLRVLGRSDREVSRNHRGRSQNSGTEVKTSGTEANGNHRDRGQRKPQGQEELQKGKVKRR